MKFSPVLLALVMVSAIMCAEYADILHIILITIAFAATLCVLSVRNRKLDLTVVILFVGFSVAYLSHTSFTGSFNHKTTEYINRYVNLSGTVITKSQRSSSGDNYRYILRVSGVGEKVKIKDSVLLTTANKLYCGDKITVSGIVKAIPEQMNENGFDMARHYKSQNVYTRIYSDEITVTGKSKAITPYILTGKFRETVDKIINRYYYGNSAAILLAVISGDTSDFSGDYKQELERTAFKRLFHPAYLHIMLLSFFIGLFHSIINKRIRDILLVSLFCVYAVFNSAQIGFLRCFIAVIMTIALKYKNGNSYYPDTMAYLCIGCSILCPAIFLNAGFVMSLTAGMLMWAFLPYVQKWFPRGFIGRTMSAMTVCALFYTPLSSVYFSGLCIYSFLLPFVMTPIVVCILILSPIVLGGLLVFGNVPVFKSYLDLMIWIVLKLPGKISALPYSYITIPTPSPSMLLALICAVFGVYYLFRKENKKWNVSLFLASAFAVSVLITALGKMGLVYFTFVNVGQGDGAVIHRTFGETVIIDGGGGSEFSDYNPGESIFVPYLSSKGYGKIDCAFISHLHKDHIEGVIAAIKLLDVENLFIPHPDNDNEEDMKKWRAELETVANENGTKIKYLYGNERIRFKSGLTIDVYPHNEVIDFSKDGNNSSMLMKVSYGETEVLYTGDMTSLCEKQYIKSGADLDADILKVAHHGSNTSTSEEWLNYIDTEYAVISCGENNVYSHPSKSVLKRLNGIKTLRTDMNGDITFVSDKKEIKKIRTLR